MFQGFHIFLEVGDAGLGVDVGVAQADCGGLQVVVHLLVIDERADGALAVVNFGADGFHGGGGVGDGFFAAVHDGVGFFDDVGENQGRDARKLDAPALGLGVLAFVGIRATKSCPELVNAVRAIAAIEECHSVAGELSMMLKVRVASTAALLELAERLRAIPGIEQTETTIVLKTQIDRPITLKPPEAPVGRAG